MVTVNNLLGRISKVEIDAIIFDSLVQVEENYIERQKEQMLTSTNSLGKRIGQYANPAYKAEKLQQNPKAGGYVDLFKEGDFQGAIFAATDNEGLRVGSTDVKSNMLEGKYKNIFTLAPVNKKAFIKENLGPVTFSVLIKKLS